MGEVTYTQVRQEVERRFDSGEFRQASASVRGPQITTAAMLRTEREIIDIVQQGNGQHRPMLVEGRERFDTVDRHPELNVSQRQAVRKYSRREKIVGMDGVAGAGKTTTLAVIREGAEREGYAVEGFAPTSRAAQKLGEAGIETSTLQMHLARGEKPDTGEKRLYVLDESSLASSKQMHEFLTRLHPNDRVLLVGDKRQHEAVEAGRPFAQLQQAGMKTVSLDQIVRQKDPELRNVVEQLARGDVGTAVKQLDEQGRVHEFRGREERIDAIAKEYAKAPESTLVVSPDNRSRTEINSRIHAELQQRGVVARKNIRADVGATPGAYRGSPHLGRKVRSGRCPALQPRVERDRHPERRVRPRDRRRCRTQSDHGCTARMDGSKATIHAASRAFRFTGKSSVHFLWATASSSPRPTMN
jgi:hypothetical protein